MRFRAEAAPSGAAVKLLLGMPAGATVLVIASLSSTPPDPAALAPTDRIVIAPGQDLHPSVWPFEALVTHDLAFWQHLDIHRSLAGSAVHYHAWFTTGSGTTDPVTREVDARAPVRTAIVAVVRDLVRERLEYHLARAVQIERLRPRAEYVPVLEMETLNKDDPMPCVLMKETISPTNQEGIGKYRKDRTDDSTGETFRQEVHRYRCRMDILALSENPAERTLLGKVIHESILIDRTLYEDIGYRETMVQSLMRSAVTPEGRWQFAEDISLDGIIEAVTEERLTYTVPGTTTFGTDI